MPFKVIIATTDSIQIEFFFFILFVQQAKNNKGRSQLFICETDAITTSPVSYLLCLVCPASEAMNSLKCRVTGALGGIEMNLASLT